MGEEKNDRAAVERGIKEAKERREKQRAKRSKDSAGRSSEASSSAKPDAAVEEQEPPPPPGRPVAVPLGKTPRYSPDADPKGVEESASDFHYYLTGTQVNGVGVLLVGDLWGWNSGRTRAVADFLAEQLNAFVAVPRLLDSPTMESGTHGDGLPLDFDLKARENELRGWLLKYPWDVLEAKVRAALTRMRASGVKKIAGVGLGFGAWVLCHASVLAGSEFVGGVLLHPTVHTMQVLHTGVHDDDDTDRLRKLNKLLSKTNGRFLLLPIADGSATNEPGGDVFKFLAARPHGIDLMPGDDPPLMAESLPFSGMSANWLDRGDSADPLVRESIVEAVHLAERYIKRRLWPLERGADAARLRLLAKEGSGEDKMLELLRFGVPAGGEDSADKQGLQPLHYAARTGKAAEATLLVKWQADLNVNGGAGGETPLHLACTQGQQKLVQQLLKLKSQPEVADKMGQCPLHHAARLGLARIVKILLSGKAKINPVDTADQTPLHMAAWHGKAPVVKLLLDAKMNVEPSDIRVKTPAERALVQGWDDVARLLDEEKGERDEDQGYEHAMLDAMPAD